MRALFATQMSERDRKAVALWLLGMGVLVAAMVLVGGATRLTDSGLSITEWRPVTGIVPPLSEAGWREEFAKYAAIPEYRLEKKGMSLDGFKAIYWWEWGHRFLGRLVGIAFLVPFAAFLVRRRLTRALAGRLLAVFLLGGLQGAVGWYMVMSGLSVRTDVSQYRLVMHLALAVALFAAILWLALSLWPRREATQRRPAPRPVGRALLAFAGLVYAQMLAGGFVAGLDAGLAYNTFPLMDGRLVPEGLFALEPWWRNLFENRIAVQFDHRLLAYLVAGSACALWALRLRGLSGPLARRIDLVLAAVVLQIALGIATLLAVVPIGLALAHQAGALLLLAAALAAAHEALAGASGRVPAAIPAPSVTAVTAAKDPAR